MQQIPVPNKVEASPWRVRTLKGDDGFVVERDVRTVEVFQQRSHVSEVFAEAICEALNKCGQEAITGDGGLAAL